jgi:predicted metallopeptidase
MDYKLANDIKKELKNIVRRLNFDYIELKNIVCFRSYGSKSRARARIWSFPKIWQLGLKLKPHYIIEVISEKYDYLAEDDKKRVLIHELMHIPKNFSGSLLPHRSRYNRINDRTVEKFFKMYKSII